MIICEISTGEIATIITLLITLYFVRRYTKATVNQTKLTIDIRDLEISPFIYFFDKEDDFYIKNFGKFPALDIEIESFCINDVKKKKFYELKFEKVNLLLSNEEKRLTYKNYVNGEETDGDIFPHIHPLYQKEFDIPLTITYKNILGEKCATNFTTGKSGLIIKSIGRIRNRKLPQGCQDGDT